MVKIVLIVLLTLGAAGFVLMLAFMYQARNSEDIVFLNEVRYQLGEHRGAAFCASCHQAIYNDWKNKSRHAVATTAGSVRETIDRLREHTILNYILGGEDMCYACHGPKAAMEGVNCETCHGPALPDAAIEESHAKVFRANRAELQKEDFCAKCHEIPGWVTPYGDWLESELPAQGITCQTCHMASPEGGPAYHGFDSFAIDQTIYENDLGLSDVRLDFPALAMTIENRIAAHGVPAGGPTRILALEVSVINAQGNVLHEDRETFAKFHRVMPVLGFWPYEIIRDTQLKTAERRHLNFSLPAELQDEMDAIHLILRFYEVADEHEGDIDRAYFSSKAILEKKLKP